MRLLILFTCIWVVNVQAQQIPQYSQFSRNQFMANPAAVGVYDFIDVTVSGRWQWVGVADAPRASYLAFSVPLKFKSVAYNPGIRTSNGPIQHPEIKTGKLKHTVGGQLVADQYGAFTKFSFSGTYAIHLPMTKKINLAFGLKAGISNNSFNSNKAQVLSLINPTLPYDNTYATFSANNANKNIMDLHSGLYLYGKRFYLGIAGDQLTRGLVEFGTASANFNPQMHFNLMGGYTIPINESLAITPSFMAKYMSPAPVSIDFNVIADYNKMLWFGIGYRHTDALIGLVGMNLSNKFKLGYSYDFSISKFNNYSSGGHELTLGIMLGR
ncbi:MAG: type IX secretion system membrane protein PorP/SprF [Bacteroidetes bacterium]|nr:type IX secretion system membrane protein PorP/SprF [Bacteroidota bacterium]